MSVNSNYTLEQKEFIKNFVSENSNFSQLPKDQAKEIFGVFAETFKKKFPEPQRTEHSLKKQISAFAYVFHEEKKKEEVIRHINSIAGKKRITRNTAQEAIQGSSKRQKTEQPLVPRNSGKPRPCYKDSSSDSEISDDDEMEYKSANSSSELYKDIEGLTETFNANFYKNESSTETDPETNVNLAIFNEKMKHEPFRMQTSNDAEPAQQSQLPFDFDSSIAPPQQSRTVFDFDSSNDQ